MSQWTVRFFSALLGLFLLVGPDVCLAEDWEFYTPPKKIKKRLVAENIRVSTDDAVPSEFVAAHA